MRREENFPNIEDGHYLNFFYRRRNILTAYTSAFCFTQKSKHNFLRNVDTQVSSEFG